MATHTKKTYIHTYTLVTWSRYLFAINLYPVIEWLISFFFPFFPAFSFVWTDPSLPAATQKRRRRRSKEKKNTNKEERTERHEIFNLKNKQVSRLVCQLIDQTRKSWREHCLSRAYTSVNNRQYARSFSNR